LFFAIGPCWIRIKGVFLLRWGEKKKRGETKERVRFFKSTQSESKFVLDLINNRIYLVEY